MLKEEDLFGKIDKVQQAIDDLKKYEPKEGYWVAVSGGKDSDVILELCKMAGVKFDAHHSLTTIDKPEAIYHLKRNLPEVEIISPDIPFLQKLETKGFPIRQGRWCCEVYKEQGGVGRCVVTGIRKAESSKRAKRSVFEVSYRKGFKSQKKTFVHPIIAWSDDEVWEFHKLRGLKHCVLYDQGSKRVGCLFCPMARHAERMKDMQDYPKYTKLFIRSFERLYARRKASGSKSIERWKNGEEMFHWWIDEDMRPKNDDPILLEYEN